jgi:putative Ca2+/H+ antiporter (TMEM165/GDT1 family)
MMIVNVPTVLFADRALKWVPVKMVRIIAALIYAVLGVVTLLGYGGQMP